jgi:hypothetical protein
MPTPIFDHHPSLVETQVRHRRLATLVLSLTVLLVTGCASGYIQPATDSGTSTLNQHLAKPAHIYVAPIDATQATYKVDADELAQIQAKVKNDLEKNLVKELGSIAPTSIGSGNSGWLIVLTPTHVDPGSATMRFVVGFGAGEAKVNVKFSLFQLQNGNTSPVFQDIQVGADTGIQTGIETLSEGNGRDVNRISREIKFFLEKQLNR